MATPAELGAFFPLPEVLADQGGLKNREVPLIMTGVKEIHIANVRYQGVSAVGWRRDHHRGHVVPSGVGRVISDCFSPAFILDPIDQHRRYEAFFAGSRAHRTARYWPRGNIVGQTLIHVLPKAFCSKAFG